MSNTEVRVQRLKLRNIRCFPELTVEFGRDWQSTCWTLLLGSNGAGKSTVLRALALALAPAHELGSMLHSDGEAWTGPETGTIEALLLIDGERHWRTVELTSSRRSTKFSSYGSAEAFVNEHPLLLAGYGAARQLQGTKELTNYSVSDSTSTLMSPEGSLQHPELAIRRAAAAGDTKALLESIDRILLLEPGSMTLGPFGLALSEPDGTTRPLTQLSDGFRGTLSWVLDLIGWQLMAREYFERQDVPTIVLVDEIEQHLHPQWQRAVVGRLREQFPTVQFIVSTHAPLCVTGTTDLPDEVVSLAYIERRLGPDGAMETHARSGMKPPRGLRADQVLTSYLFGLSSTRDRATNQTIDELSTLLSKPERSPTEQARVEQLQGSLSPLLGSAETSIEREVQRAALDAAEAVLKTRLGTMTPTERDRVLDVRGVVAEDRARAPAAAAIQSGKSEHPTISSRIRKARQNRSWSQEELASLAGLSLRTIARIERDDGLASKRSQRKVARALGLDLDSLFGDDDA